MTANRVYTARVLAKEEGLIENDAWRVIAFLALVAGAAVLVVRNNRAYRRVDPGLSLVVLRKPRECIQAATAHMAQKGYSVAHVGDTSATYTRARKPNTGVGVLLLLLGLIPGLLYFGLFKGTARSTLVATPDDDRTRLIFSGDDAEAQLELYRWAKEDLTAP